MHDPRRTIDPQESSAPLHADARFQSHSTGYHRETGQLESSNDNRSRTSMALFKPSRKHIIHASGFGVGALLALLAMMNGSAFYQAESRIFVDAKQVQLQSGAGDAETPDMETESRIVNEKLIAITSPAILDKVVENLSLQKVRLFDVQDDTNIFSILASWYRSLFQREPVVAGMSEFSTPVEQLESAIFATQDDRSSVIAIKVTTTKPRTSALIANQLADLMKVTENKPAPLSTVSQADLDAMLAKVQKADQDVADFQVQVPLSDGTSDVSRLQNELQDLHGKSTQIEKSIALLKKSGAGSVNLNMIPEDLLNGKFYGLKAQLLAAQSRVSELSQNLGPKHPDLLAAMKVVDSLTADMRKELPALIRALETDLADKKSTEASLVEQLQNLQGSAASLPASAATTLEDLQRQSETLHAQYATMQANGPNQKAPDPVIRLVSKATVPANPVQAGGLTTLFASLVGGVLGMLTTAVALFGNADRIFSAQRPEPRTWVAPKADVYDEQDYADERDDDDLDDLSRVEAELEAREKELELQEMIALNARLERLAGLLDQSRDDPQEARSYRPEHRSYPKPNENLYHQVYSKAANRYPPAAAFNEQDTDSELAQVRRELRSLRGKVARYAGQGR